MASKVSDSEIRVIRDTNPKGGRLTLYSSILQQLAAEVLAAREMRDAMEGKVRLEDEKLYSCVRAYDAIVEFGPSGRSEHGE